MHEHANVFSLSLEYTYRINTQYIHTYISYVCLFLLCALHHLGRRWDITGHRNIALHILLYTSLYIFYYYYYLNKTNTTTIQRQFNSNIHVWCIVYKSCSTKHGCTIYVCGFRNVRFTMAFARICHKNIIIPYVPRNTEFD